MLVALSFAWGLTWPAMRIALDEIPPFSMRVVTLGLGAASLLIVGGMQGRAFALGGLEELAHLAVAGILNVLSFSLLSVIAMMFAATGRVAMLSYTMPIWAALFAWLVLGERLTRASVVALVLCIAGMAILIWPLAQQRHPDRPVDRGQHRGELGGRNRLHEMGAPHRRSGRECGVAGVRRIRDRHGVACPSSKVRCMCRRRTRLRCSA